MRLFYSPEYTLAGHDFDTTRKAAWVADSLVAEPIPGVEVRAPAPLTEAQVAQVHDPAYVEAVRTGQPRGLAESQGFRWDAGLFPMVLASNGGAVAAALAALGGEATASGSLSSGLHHARVDRGNGVCTFNGLAIAARAALAAGARSVLVLDLDAHCGGGTHSLVRDDPRIRHVDVSVHGFDHYEPAGENTLDFLRDAERYLPTIAARLERLGRFDLCIYNAGMDPFEGCGMGGLRGITREMLARREALVFDWGRERETPIAFVLAGGYLTEGTLDRDGLVALHRATIMAAARQGPH